MAKSKIGGSETSIMPSSPFLRGLNTELSGVVDSTDFTKEELNMMIRADNTRSRRFGMDYEEDYKFCNQYIGEVSNNYAFNCIEWTDYNAPDEAQEYVSVPYLVVQIGGQIIFYRNKGLPFSGAQEEYVLDLAEYRLDNTDDVAYKTERCKFTTAYGCLFITSKAIKPIRLRTAAPVEDPVVIVSDSTAVCSCTTQAFRWERYRRARYTRVQKTEQDAWYLRIYLNDVLLLSNVSTEDKELPCSWEIAAEFNNLPAEVRKGITAVPEFESPNYPPVPGKYDMIPDSITFKAPEDSGDTLSGTKIEIRLQGWYKRFTLPVGNGVYRYRYSKVFSYTCYLSGGYAYTQDTALNLRIRDTSVGAKDYLNISDSTPRISYAHLYNLYNQGWTQETIAKYYVALKRFPANNLAQQYLKDTKTSSFKPENLINMTFGNTPAAKGHFILEYFNQDRLEVGGIVQAMDTLVTAINDEYIAQEKEDRVTVEDIISSDITDPPNAEEEIPVVKPRSNFVTDICAYAGRIFYLSSDTVLYSQVIAEDITKSDKCYSDADPTSEELSDLIETDGGHISLPEIGEGVKLAQLGTYLLIFGTRENMFITGTANNLFTATAYTTGTLPVSPTQAPYSFVNTEFGLFYWGTTSVNFIGTDGNGLAPRDLTTDRMLNWFGRLTNKQHEWCKGVYSAAKKKVYWFYPSDEEKPRCLDLCLVYDIQKDAFTTHSIVSSLERIDDDGDIEIVTGLPEIVSGVSLKVPFKSVKEYPITASSRNIDTRDNWVATLGSVALEEAPYVFRFDASVFGDLKPGEEQDLVKFNGKVIEWVSRDANDVLYRHYGIKGEEDNYSAIAEDFVQGEGFFANVTGSAELGFQAHLQHIYNSNVSAEDIALTSFPLVDWVNDSSIDTDATFGVFEVYAPLVNLEVEGGFGSGSYDADTNTILGWSWLSDPGLKVVEVLDNKNYKVIAEDPISSEEFSYESSTILCFDVANGKVTFGDFRNNLLRDWVAGDFEGIGYNYDSYLISHPMNAVGYTKSLNPTRANSIVYNKNMPYLLSYFRRTEVGKTVDDAYLYPSKCQGSILWDWRTSGEHGKWDSPQELYRPNKRTILSEGYVITKTNIRGMGRAFQVKLQSVEDNQMIVEALCFDVMNDGRI